MTAFFGRARAACCCLCSWACLATTFWLPQPSAKLVNVATNLASLSYFIFTKQVLFAVALPMAACNMLGSTLGARLAQQRGTGFVRGLFLVVVSAVILKLGWETFGV